MVEFSIFEKLDDLNAHFRKYGNKDGYLLGTITIFFYNFFLSRFRPKVTTWSLQQRLRPSRLVRPHRDRGRRELLLPGWLMQLMLPRSSQIFPDSKKTRTGSPGAAFALSKRTFDPTGSGLGFFPTPGTWWCGGRMVEDAYPKFDDFHFLRPVDIGCSSHVWWQGTEPLNQPSLYPSVEISPVYSTMFP